MPIKDATNEHALGWRKCVERFLFALPRFALLERVLARRKAPAVSQETDIKGLRFSARRPLMPGGRKEV